MNAEYVPNPLVKINSMQATASSRKWSNVVERIRRELKTYKNLFDELISDENIILAIKNATKKKKKKRPKAREMRENPEKYVQAVRDYVVNFKHFEHTPHEIYDGISRKKRTIVIPSLMECVLHHAIVNVLKPMFTCGMYEHSCGSVPKRGGMHARKYIAKWIKRGGKNIKYFAKLDIKGFYKHIDQDKLIEKLEKKIHDHRFMRIIVEVIRSVPEGLPLGFYTSVWLGNWYLSELDHTIKEEYGIVYYVRNVDDMALFGANKKKLHKAVKGIAEELVKLGLELKHDWQVSRFIYYEDEHCKKGRALDYIGYKFYRNRVQLRKSILLKMRRKAVRIWYKERITAYDAKQMMSALGWIKSADIYGYYERHIKSFVNFGKLKKIVSEYDRKAAQNDGLCIS